MFIAGCAGIPAPKGYGCVTFVAKGRSLCYNLATDFDPKTGNVADGAKGERVPLTMEWFDRRVSFDPDSYASLKAYLLKIKQRCEAKQ